jgi:hypothetical protein
MLSRHRGGDGGVILQCDRISRSLPSSINCSNLKEREEDGF